MDATDLPYYRSDLALVHHLGFAAHAHACAPGLIEWLAPVRERNGLVLELGCGSGLLTRHLVQAGHRVLATDASPAMLELARGYVPEGADFRLLALPDDPIPEADAIVSVGHVLSYLSTEGEIWRACAAICRALRPGGFLAVDICDLRWAETRRDAPAAVRVDDDWVLVARFSTPAPDRFVREMTSFLRSGDGSWRRADERHENVLIDTRRIPGVLRGHDVEVVVGSSFGGEKLPDGLATVMGRRSP